MILRLARPLRAQTSFNAQRRRLWEETPMERKLVDVGHRVETQLEPGLASDLTRTATASGEGEGIVTGARDALQSALKKTASVVGNGIQERSDEVIAYARREPVAALTAAAGIGFLIGLVLAIGSRPGASGGRAWLPQLNSRQKSFLGRRKGSGWREFLRLE